MRSYQPGQVTDPSLRREFEAIQKAARRADLLVALEYVAVAPSKPQDGLYLSAAGVLGANRGLYRYDSNSGTYTFIA